MKAVIKTCLISGLVASGVAHAEPGPVYTLGVASDFVWRGISHSDEDAVYQAGARYQDKSGMYIGLWTTTLERVVYPLLGNPDLRLDGFLGAKVQTPSGFGWDIGVNVSRFDESDVGFEEVYLGFSFGQLSTRVSHDWNNDNLYTEVGGNFDIGSGLVFGLHAGHYNGDTVTTYNDYGASLSTDVNGWQLALKITDTDIKPTTDVNNTKTTLSIQRNW